MKPIRLRIRNLGPYVDSEIDFSELDSLFLITGSTGSGKTFIFDAMSYAIYGKASGIRGGFTKENLISDYYNETDDAFAEFVFGIGETVYSVRRYAKRNSKPRTTVLEEKKSTDGGRTFVECEKDEIEKAVKLTKEEFEKVILLPQGEFQRFLVSTTKEKREILSRMFPVEKFTRIVRTINDRANEITTQVKDLNKSAERAGGGRPLGEYREEEKNLLAQMENLQAENEKFRAECDDEKLKIEALKKEAGDAEKKSGYEKKLAVLESKKNEIDSKSVRITLAKKANPLGEFVRNAESARKNLAEKSRQKISLAEEKERRENELAAAEERGGKIPGLEKKIQECVEKRQGMVTLLSKAKEYEAAAEKFSVTEKKLQAATEKRGAAEKEIEAAKKNLPAGKNAADVHVEFLAEIQDLTEKIAFKKSDVENAKKFEILSEEISEIEKSIPILAEKKKKAEDEKKSVDEEIERTELEKELHETRCRASVLAKKLKVGLPCPVCGSTEHPFPATENEPKDFAGILETLKRRRMDSEKELRDSEKELSKSEQSLELKKDGLSKIVFKKSHAEEKSELAELEEKLLAAEKNAEDAKRLCNLLESLEKNLLECREKEAEFRTEFTAAETAMRTIEKDFDGKDISCNEIESEMAEIDGAKKEAEAEKNEINGLLKNLRVEAGALGGKLAALMEEISRAEKNAADAEKILCEKLAASEFKSAGEAEKHFLSENEISIIEDEISEHEKKLGEVRAVLETLADVRSIEEIEKNISAETEKFSAAQKNLREISEIQNEKNRKLGEIKKTISEMEGLEKEKKELLEKEKILTYLKEKFSGKTHLDSWALTTYYSEIVELASRRFNRFSNGQYTFEMNQDFSKGRATTDTSLDLVINDGSSGGERDVKNLSGGERFEASISLALAITDSVQNRNGGIELDSIFIDEGFGSLDAATREKVMPILRELQERKTVGIISHVESFLDEIPSQIHVEKGSSGSKIRV